ncbi:MAG: HlyD family efflux transporter periplasmic adaptor subunit [Pseudomonadota bacterium]
MIRVLKKRPRSDNAVIETRRSSGSVGRRVYLGLLGLLVLAIANYLWGARFVLNADGFVLREQTVVEAIYLAKVESIPVREGQHVSAGEPLLQLRSIEILERLAELSARHAGLVQRSAELKTDALVASQLAPLAQRREQEAQAALGNVEALTKDGLTTAARREEVLRALNDAREAQLRYSAQAEALRKDLPSIESARNSAAAALANLREQYAGGVVRAPTDGFIGVASPSPGEVFRPGEPLIKIYSGSPFCLAYLPNDYLFPIREGAKVLVRSGRRSAHGVIDEILPVSSVLPDEFQQRFRPQDRSQLAKIRFEDETEFSIGEKVSVSLRPFR